MNWPAFATTAGAALALSTGASAGMIYSGPENITATAGGPAAGTSVQNLDIGGVNFQLEAKFLTAGPQASVRLANVSHGSVGHNSAGGILKLASGGGIGVAGPAWQSQGALQFKNGGGSGGSWMSGQSGFAAIRFKAGTGPFDFDYGWIRLVVSDNLGGYPASVTALDWAYNDSLGMAVTAGEGMPSTPEPGTMALMILASGAAGVTALRRHRAKTAA